MSKVVLASSSFTRKKILEDAGLVFSVEVPNVDEQELKGALLFKGASGEDIAGFLAEHKSCIVSTRVPSALVIGADQVLECEGIIYSKPKNLVAAKEQLNTLRGKKHTLISSVVVAEGGKRIWEHTDRSLLHMRKFSDCFLDEYISKQGKSLLEAVKLMRGPVGTSIDLTIRRKNVKKPLEFRIMRKIIQVRSVNSKIIGKEKNLGYIRLKSFNENSDKQFLKSVKNLEAKSKIKGYVLDLRNNPGGLLTQAINITDFFLNDGEIVSTKGRKISETRKFFARKGDEIKGKPIVVLINNGSASASEIFAGALKDHKRAIILGENSYGKGSVQSIIPLKNGGGMRLTISKYYLPSGKSISEVGVTPDILVEEEGEDFLINTDNDNQLNYAIKLFSS